VVVVHPDGAVAGPPAEVADELARRAAADGNGPLDRAAIHAIHSFLTDGRDRTASPGGRRGSGQAGRPADLPATARVVPLPAREPARPDRGTPARRPAA